MSAMSTAFLDRPLDLRPPARAEPRDDDTASRKLGREGQAKDGLEARFLAPVTVTDPSTGFVLVRAGVVVHADRDREIHWMRLLLQTREQTLASLFPQTVARPVTYNGRIHLTPTGAISRRSWVRDVAETTYEPFVVGHQPSATAVSWDFMPADPTPHLACDRLLFSTRAHPQILTLTAGLMIGVAPRGGEPKYLRFVDDLQVD